LVFATVVIPEGIMMQGHPVPHVVEAALKNAVLATPGSALDNLFKKCEVRVQRADGTVRPYCVACYRWMDDEEWIGGHKGPKHNTKVLNQQSSSLHTRLVWAVEACKKVNEEPGEEGNVAIALEQALVLCPEAMEVFRAKTDANVQTIPGPPGGGPPFGAGLPPPAPAGPASGCSSSAGSWSLVAHSGAGAAGAPGLALPQAPAPNVAEVEVLQNRVKVLEEEVAALTEELRDLRDAFDRYWNKGSTW